ncbi:MAG: MmgE/PrpD family protein [Pseudomonadota bacterium]
MTGISNVLAARALQCFSDADRDAAWRALFDTVTVGVGAWAHEAAALKAIIGLVCEGRPDGPVRVPGHARPLPAPQAAAVLALACHSIDCDDTYMEGGVKTHISAIVVPAAFAVAQAVDASMEALLDAICAGIEVEARLGHLVVPVMVQRWHPTGTLGPIGAAAAAARLLGLDAAQTEQALGLAGDAAAGTRVCLDQGDASKSMHAAYAARHGVEAALLVARGAIGPVGFFEARQGYLDSYVGGHVADWGPDGARVHANSVKFYPAMHALHAAIRALVDLRQAHGAGEAASITVTQSSTHARFGRATDPKTPLAARLSLTYCAAASWLDGACGFAQFTPQRLFDPALRALMTRVHVEGSEALERDFPNRIASRVEVQLTGGRRLEAFVADPPGCPQNPATEAMYRNKMTELLEPATDPAARQAWLAEFTARRTTSARALAALAPRPLGARHD